MDYERIAAKRRRIAEQELTQIIERAQERMTVPLHVTVLMGGAFYQCVMIIEINLPETLRTISKEAFSGCTSLTGISFPHHLELIEYNAFEDCTSLMGVEFPDSNRDLILEGDIFRGCKALVNIYLPRNVVLHDGCEEDLFPKCKSLLPVPVPPQSQRSGRSDFFFHQRFNELPVHKACYHAKSTKVDDLLATIDSEEEYPDCTLDGYGMSPLHIVASSAVLRIDLMEALINKYEMRFVFREKDDHKKTVMDYLLANRASNSAQMIKMVLRRIFEAGWDSPYRGWTDWGLERWKRALCAEIESKSWDGDYDSRRRCLRGLMRKVAMYGRKEMTSLLELALWKVELNRGDSDRDSSRINCGADMVIENVIGYIHDDWTAANVLSTINILGRYLSWLKGVFRDYRSPSDDDSSSDEGPPSEGEWPPFRR
mmetsp:Transcript_3772/g.8649  ORF Transcript_3772/g.8649 Transcript_3772/m.8649 type:complete len:427 (-) Transcript_3772:1096-2376(-)